MSKSILLASVLLLASLAALTLRTPGSADRNARADEHEPPVLPVDNLPTEIDLNLIPDGLEQRPDIPADNPLTEEKVRLGRRLFFDPILSENNTVACASCHQPDHGFASPDERAVGIRGAVGKRNVPSIINRAYGKAFLWDGSAGSLEEQALTPIGNPDEFGGSVEAVLEAIRADDSYVRQFEAAFPNDEGLSETETIVTGQRLAQALASFERTLIRGDSQVDRFRSADYDAMSKTARQGMWIFESRGGCWKCHSGPNLTDEEFHNTGVGFDQPDRDDGRMRVTRDEAHRHQIKTPSLRGVEHTAPYMHNGSIKTLREVVEFYNRGGAPDDPQLDNKLKPLKLSDEEIGYLVDFLKALSN
jgi:cytochrome c peroxidase